MIGTKMEADPAYYKNGSKIRGGFPLHTNRWQLPAFGFCDIDIYFLYSIVPFKSSLFFCFKIILCALPRIFPSISRSYIGEPHSSQYGVSTSNEKQYPSPSYFLVDF